VRKKVRRRTLTFLRLLFLSGVAIFVISYLSVHKLLFVNKTQLLEGENLIAFATRTRANLKKKYKAEEFRCTTQDGHTLAGMVIEREKPVGTLLLCHGYRCCKEMTAGYVELFPQYNTILFDFRAHGENKRTLTTIGCKEYQDIPAIVAWAKKHKPQLFDVPFIILGVSMGGAAALKATENHPDVCDALVIDSSFSSLRSVLENTFATKSGLPTFPFLPIMERMFAYFCSCSVDSLRPVKSIKKIKQPLLLIHSCIDTFVPVQESLLMYAQGAKSGAKLWIAPECKHGWLHKKYPKLYRKKINRFLEKKVFSKSLSTNLTTTVVS